MRLPPPGWFPYGQPYDPAALAQCDPLIASLVALINRTATELGPWTVQSCEGHPWPMLELVGEPRTLARIAAEMLAVLDSKQQLVVTVIVPPAPFDGDPRSVPFARWRYEVSANNTPLGRQLGRQVLGVPWGWIEATP